MNQIPNNNSPMTTLTEAVAYFLAGSFIIETLFVPIISASHSLNNLTFGDIFTICVGFIMIIYAFILSITAARVTGPTSIVRSIPKLYRVSIWLSPVLFAITFCEIIFKAVTFNKIPELHWMFGMTIAFCIFVLCAIWYVSIRVYFTTQITNFLWLIISFCVMAIASVLSKNPPATSVLIIIIILLTSVRILHLYRRQQGFQLSLFKSSIFKRK